MLESQAFKQRMLARSSETAKKALAKKLKTPTAVKKQEPQTQLSVLREILAFLKNYQAGQSGAVEFLVTGRDDEGKIKSFKVES